MIVPSPRGFRLFAALLFATTLTANVRAEQSVPAAAAVTGEVSDEFLALVMRHLYRWYLDETALVNVDASEELELLLRDATPALDGDDRSRYLEIRIPALAMQVVMKKADYPLTELDMRVVNADYRVVRAGRLSEPVDDPDRYQRRILNKAWLMGHLFAIRNERSYPDAALVARLRSAFQERYGRVANEGEAQTVYVAPISPVANNLWVFWESAGKIIRFSSDSDLGSEAYWSMEKLGVDLYDLDEDVVVSLAEVPGSNAYVTRDWAARVLYNCVVFGRRMVIDPAGPAPEPDAVGPDSGVGH
jgi:hypothetical protein